MPVPTGRGLRLDFGVSVHPVDAGHPDLDNLCEPVFSVLANRLGWFGGSRPGIAWWLATKRAAVSPGLRIDVVEDAPPLLTSMMSAPVIDAVHDGDLPRSARDLIFIDWVARHLVARPLGPLSVALLFGDDRVNLGDVATGRVKNLIDCLQPVLGGPVGNPDDHRIVALFSSKAVADVQPGAVRVVAGPGMYL
jgi:hypothetical protein